jgi:hypothetical protein
LPDLPQECDLWVDDCPPGSKCMPWAPDGQEFTDTRCVSLAEDPHDVGEPCTVEGDAASGIDDCEAHSMCWNVDADTNMGECVAFCEGDESNGTCTDPCSQCHVSAASVLILCLPSCDPLAQDCMKGQGCYATNNGFTCIPDLSDGGGGMGDACEFINVCAPGLWCADAAMLPDCADATGCCTPFCDTSAANPCPGAGPGVECVPWGEPLACGPATVGVCVLP